MMKFKKGDPRPANAGIKKGTKQAKTLAWERIGEYLINRGSERYMDYLESIEDKEYAMEFKFIMEYFKPKQARTELTAKDGDDLFKKNPVYDMLKEITGESKADAESETT